MRTAFGCGTPRGLQGRRLDRGALELALGMFVERVGMAATRLWPISRQSRGAETVNGGSPKAGFGNGPKAMAWQIRRVPGLRRRDGAGAGAEEAHAAVGDRAGAAGGERHGEPRGGRRRHDEGRGPERRAGQLREDDALGVRRGVVRTTWLGGEPLPPTCRSKAIWPASLTERCPIRMSSTVSPKTTSPVRTTLLLDGSLRVKSPASADEPAGTVTKTGCPRLFRL